MTFRFGPAFALPAGVATAGKPYQFTFEYSIIFDDGREEKFVERIEISPRKIPPAAESRGAAPTVDFILQNLSLILGISYYKIYAPENVEFTYPLSPKQLEFWNTVYRKGLGEFWYRNNLNPRVLSERSYPSVSSAGSADSTTLPFVRGGKASNRRHLISPFLPLTKGEHSRAAREGVLLGIGGGKDSIVAAEMLRAEGVDVTAFVVETQKDSEIVENVVKVLDVPVLKVKRTLDEKLFQKWEGGYNGHVPISAVYAWLGVLLAQMHGFRWVAVGNEYSSNFGNLKYHGEEINHQWSKTGEFEKLVQDYVREFITPDIGYFSVLRPFYELRITGELAQPGIWEKYKNVFCSCNRAFRIQGGPPSHKASARSAPSSFSDWPQASRSLGGGWCGECPKCAFVFAMLAAFLAPEEVVSVFGKNLFNDEKLLPTYRDLLGWGDLKPFDCVGTFEETRAAIWAARERYAGTRVVKEFAGKITDGEKLWGDIMKAQRAETVPHRFRFSGMKNALILGYGREGKVTEKFLKQQYPKLEIDIADQADDPNYLTKQSDYDIAIKTPGIPKDKVKIQYTTATNIFFSRLPAGRQGVQGLTIGVTGSKGKSTTASLIAAILKEADRNVVLAGNIGKPMLGEIPHPNPILRKERGKIYVLELSSAQLDDIAFSPNIAVITNLFPEHMDYHGSEEAYYEAKRNIIRWQKPGDVFVYDDEHPKLKEWAGEAKEKTVPFVKELPLDEKEIPLLGEHNRKNIAAAVAIAKELGVSDEVIARAIREFKGLPHRLEFVGEFKGIRFYDDAISTAPESTIAAIAAIPNIGTIFLGGTDRGYDFSELAKVIKKAGIKNAVLFPDSGKRIKPLLADLNLLDLDSTPRVESGLEVMEKAVKFAYENTEPGRAVLLSCASPSYSLWRDFEEKGENFQKAIKKLA